MIVLTTPTGNIGRQLLNLLLERGAPVRAIARDASKLPADARGRIEVVEGSHGDAATVEKAFAGADAVFWLSPPKPTTPSLEEAYLGFTRPAAEAFRRQGVPRVVGVSALGRGTPLGNAPGWSRRR